MSKFRKACATVTSLVVDTIESVEELIHTVKKYREEKNPIVEEPEKEKTE